MCEGYRYQEDEEKLNDERKFMEDVMNERFNFFLVFIAIIIGGAITTRMQILFQFILTFGLLISICIWATIYRAYCKQYLLGRKLFSEYQKHPAKWVDDEAKKGFCLFSVRKLIAIYIPLICNIVLFAGVVSAWCGCLKID